MGTFSHYSVTFFEFSATFEEIKASSAKNMGRWSTKKKQKQKTNTQTKQNKLRPGLTVTVVRLTPVLVQSSSLNKTHLGIWLWYDGHISPTRPEKIVGDYVLNMVSSLFKKM